MGKVRSCLRCASGHNRPHRSAVCIFPFQMSLLYAVFVRFSICISDFSFVILNFVYYFCCFFFSFVHFTHAFPFIFCISAIQNKTLPGTISYEKRDPPPGRSPFSLSICSFLIIFRFRPRMHIRQRSYTSSFQCRRCRCPSMFIFSNPF